MKNEELYQNIVKKYDIEKLGSKEFELFEIINKLDFYEKRTKKWYLRPFYRLTRLVAAFIVDIEAKNALKSIS